MGYSSSRPDAPNLSSTDTISRSPALNAPPSQVGIAKVLGKFAQPPADAVLDHPPDAAHTRSCRVRGVTMRSIDDRRSSVCRWQTST